MLKKYEQSIALLKFHLTFEVAIKQNPVRKEKE
jgi:hypothetical protein